MNPLLLHLDSFLVRALQQRCFIRGKTVISLFIGWGAIFTSLFRKKDKNCMGIFLICWVLGLKMNLIINGIILGMQGNLREEKHCATVEMALFPIKQAAAAHERLYP